MRRRRNTMARISSLPEEVLVGVFLMVVGEPVPSVSAYLPDKGYPSRISALSQVSTEWNRMINFTPQLWCRISTNTPPPFIRASLQRSGTTPLSFEGDLSQGPLDRTQMESALEVVNQITRWKEANVTVVSSSDTDILTYSGAPMLKKFILTCKRIEPTPPFPLFNGDAPNLEYLDLTRVPVPWSSKIFMGLQTLNLSNITGPPLDAFLQVLRAIPTLKELRLFDFRLSATDDPIRSPRASPELPELRLLHLSYIPLTSLSLLTHNITSTSLRCINIG